MTNDKEYPIVFWKLSNGAKFWGILQNEQNGYCQIVSNAYKTQCKHTKVQIATEEEVIKYRLEKWGIEERKTRQEIQKAIEIVKNQEKHGSINNSKIQKE